MREGGRGERDERGKGERDEGERDEGGREREGRREMRERYRMRGGGERIAMFVAICLNVTLQWNHY